MDQFINLHTVEEYKKAIEERCIILVTATWCPDCIFIKPFIGEVAKARPSFKYYQIDRDELLDLCKEMDVMGIPSFVAYDQGVEIGRFVSKFRKTRHEIEEFIDGLN